MNPCKSLYQKIRYILNFDDDISSKTLDEFNKLFKSSINFQEELKNSLKQAINNLCNFMETLPGVNSNYFIRLTYLLNIDFVEEIKNVSQNMDQNNEMVQAILITYNDFKIKYSFSNDMNIVLKQPSIGVDISIPSETIKQFRELLYNIYLHMFHSRTIKKVFIILSLNDKKLSIKFSDTFITQLSNSEWFPEFINLDDYKINFTEDDRIIRNRIFQIELRKKVDEMEKKITTIKNNKKIYEDEIINISAENNNHDIKLIKIINLLEKTEDISNIDINEINAKIDDYKNKISFLSNTPISNISFY